MVLLSSASGVLRRPSTDHGPTNSAGRPSMASTLPCPPRSPCRSMTRTWGCRSQSSHAAGAEEAWAIQGGHVPCTVPGLHTLSWYEYLTVLCCAAAAAFRAISNKLSTRAEYCQAPAEAMPPPNHQYYRFGGIHGTPRQLVLVKSATSALFLESGQGTRSPHLRCFLQSIFCTRCSNWLV
ncbi:hypothetical protein EV126DRAFT_40076 [Verticillium dahliae]|nr:hypothetical protein EV126DRAFT_40076 [Verticillium dahliae]